MKQFQVNAFTFGYEIEFGDVNRRLTIPPELGKWETAETDIVNLRPPYALVACDPLGLVPPMGGEINTVPTLNWQAPQEVSVWSMGVKAQAQAGVMTALLVSCRGLRLRLGFNPDDLFGCHHRV